MRVWAVRFLSLAVALCLAGCARGKIVTVTFPKMDGNSEYWVCDRDATNCHGQGEGDVDPMLYKPGLDTLSPPIQCDHGAARIEIVVKGNHVTQIGYECAQPPAPTETPDGPAGRHLEPTGLPGEPTGLPEEPIGLPDEEPTDGIPQAEEASDEAL